jgi:EAL domain-containing protein (putative c-di-GMP-specific phosphodiesterase class I)
MQDASGQAGAARMTDTPRFAIAFQPIVDIKARRVIAHEALLRGPGGTPADGVLARVKAPDRPAFETAAIDAIVAARGDEAGDAALHVNISPAVLLREAGMLDALAAGLARAGFAPSRLVIEVTEGERIDDADALRAVIAAAHAHGMRIALDDFGTGYGGLGLLAETLPDLVKLDMTLVRDIHHHRVRRSLVSGIVGKARALGLGVIAVGVESEGEYHCLTELGLTLVQGFLLAPPVTGRAIGMDEIALPVRRAVPAWLGAVDDQVARRLGH